MLVIDAGVLFVALVDGGPQGAVARARLRDQSLIVPELIDLEVLSVIRREVLGGTMDADQASRVLDDLTDLPLRRVSHRPLLRRCWELHRNVTSYDASYVALAEALDANLLTTDARLSRAPGVRCIVEVLQIA